MTRDMRSHYLHGTDPVEQRRLGLMNDLINARSLAELGLRGGERVLDLGAGLAQFARAMARQGARVVAVERDEEQVGEARRLAERAGEGELIRIRCGDAFEPPLEPAEWGSFDIAHARFVLEHVPHPQRLVEVMVRAVRPGGRVVLADDDHTVMRLWPEPRGFRTLWNAYWRVFERLGLDPNVGRRLVALLHAAGARPVRNTWVFYGGCAGDGTFGAAVDNLYRVVSGAKAEIVARGLLDGPAVERGLARFAEWALRDDAALWYAICWAEGRTPHDV